MKPVSSPSVAARASSAHTGDRSVIVHRKFLIAGSACPDVLGEAKRLKKGFLPLRAAVWAKIVKWLAGFILIAQCQYRRSPRGRHKLITSHVLLKLIGFLNFALKRQQATLYRRILDQNIGQLLREVECEGGGVGIVLRRVGASEKIAYFLGYPERGLDRTDPAFGQFYEVGNSADIHENIPENSNDAIVASHGGGLH